MPNCFKRLKFVWDYFVRGKYRSPQCTHINSWVEPPLLDAELWFGSLLVADLRLLSPHQGTWSSEYALRISADQGELQNRVLGYIAFCEDFDRRIANGQDHDFDEFERFTPIPNCESWSVRLPNGCLVPMEGRMWFADGEAGWQHPETEPSTESAANEFWAQNTPGK